MSVDFKNFFFSLKTHVALDMVKKCIVGRPRYLMSLLIDSGMLKSSCMVRVGGIP